MANVADADYQLGFELYEMLPDAILAVDRQGVIRYANRQAGRLFGQDQATLVSTSVEALLPEHLRERHIAHRAEFNLEPRRRHMGSGLDLIARRADGATFPVDIMLNPLRHLAEPMTLAVVRDMTEARAIEEQKQKFLMHDRLQFALDAAQLGWWQYDLIRNVVWWDARLKEMFDIAADWTDIEEFKRRVHPDDIDRVWAAVEAAIDPANPVHYTSEFRRTRGDGEVRWIEAHALVHFEGSGRERRAVSMVGTAQDITERKRHEEERKQQEERERLLMREVNHRAKNMLSVVETIARQTATDNRENFVGRFSDRIQALAANQDLLIRNEWQGVETQDLVRAQLMPFASLTGRIGADGPKLRLKATAAQAIGLALHELATNAGKYGSLSTETGRVDVGWGTEGDTFTMSWTEREGPPVAAPKRRGFGTVVMKEMAERSVDGRVELEYAPSGVTWSLSCPAANALEPTA